jgi:repressor LexA
VSDLNVLRSDIVAFIVAYATQHGFAPTVREIARGVGCSSSSTVQAQLDILEAQGWITLDQRIARSIVVVK